MLTYWIVENNNYYLKNKIKPVGNNSILLYNTLLSSYKKCNIFRSSGVVASPAVLLSSGGADDNNCLAPQISVVA